MSRKDLKNRTSASISIRNDLLERLRQLSRETDIPQTKLLDRALELLFEKKEKSL